MDIHRRLLSHKNSEITSGKKIVGAGNFDTHRQSRAGTPIHIHTLALIGPKSKSKSKSLPIEMKVFYSDLLFFFLHSSLVLLIGPETIVICCCCCFGTEFKFRILCSFHSQFLINHSHGNSRLGIGYDGRRRMWVNPCYVS